ncbi:MAG: DnaB-like helicase C-terminal domain-containing protein [Acidimicrobiia bacterium]
MSYDRDEVLERTDLRALFGELVGSGRGQGQRAMWPCPSPNHAQTGKTPPVSIDANNRLWNCHGCDAGGTAVDLLVLKQGLRPGEALAELAARAGVRPDDRWSARGRAPHPAPVPAAAAPPPPVGTGARNELRAYVETAARLLWEPEGEAIRQWLHARGLGEEILRANRIGADPGPRALPRAQGLPRGGQGAVFPVIDGTGGVSYCQLRFLEARGSKYHNPQESRYGANPRMAVVTTPDNGVDGPVLVCEGMPDALTAAQAGYRAAAVLGVGLPDARVAEALVAAYPSETLVVAFDGDSSGDRGAQLLGDLLVRAGAGRRVRRLSVPETVSQDAKDRDLNTWAVTSGDRFPSELEAALAASTPLGWEPVVSAADLLPRFYAIQEDQDGALAIPTGIAGLDYLLAHGGWRPGLVLLGGLAGAGKTAFALATSVHAGLHGHPVVYVSVEQSAMEMLGRLFCRELGVGIAAYWNRIPSYVAGAREVSSRLPLSELYFRSDPAMAIDDEGTVGRVRRWATSVAELTGRVPLVVVDYLQRMRPPEGDRRQDPHRQISLAGLGLRQLARDLCCPVVAISSIGRASYDRAPSLDAFKGSGDLEYDADACFLLRVAAANEDEAKALLARQGTLVLEMHAVKNRYGPETGTSPVLLDFDRGHGAFRQHGTRTTARAAASNNGSPPPNPPPVQLLTP